MYQAQVGTEPKQRWEAPPLSGTVTVVRKEGDGKVIDLHSPVTFFGSHKEAQIRLKHPSIAPAHTAVINTGRRLLLCDLASRSGTTLNGEPVRMAELKTGDDIRIGAWRFRVTVANQPPRATCGGSSITATQLDALPSLDIESVDSGKRWPNLTEVAIIGRRDTCDIMLKGNRVSRAHALLCHFGDTTAVFDLKSANGVRVNGRLTSTSRVKQDDVIVIGGHALRITAIRGGIAPTHTLGGSTPGLISERIRFSGPAGEGSSGDFMRLASVPPNLIGGGRFDNAPSRRQRLAGLNTTFDEPDADADSDASLAARERMLAAREKKLEEQTAELEAARHDIEARELAMGDREHLLQSSARKLLESQQKTTKAADSELAQELGKRESALEALEQQLESRAAELDRRNEQLRRKSAQLDDKTHAAQTRDAWMDARGAELEEREQRLVRMVEEVKVARGSARAATDVERVPNIDQLTELERDLKAREGVLNELGRKLDTRSEAIAVQERELKARKPVLSELSKSLDTRASDLETKHAKVMGLLGEIETWRNQLSERAVVLNKREAAIVRREQSVMQDSGSLAITDERSVEVLRMLDPDLGDSVRVLRRLGIEGSFDELVDRARVELDARVREKKGRTVWNLFC